MSTSEKGPIRALAGLGGIGFMLAAMAIVGWMVGRYLDGLLGTSPWLSLVGSLLGMAAGFFEVIVLARRAEKENSGGEGE